ncbi:MAG: sulfatase-like hydrolase/transferase [Isosphaeraceae bacterium]
MHVRVGLVLAGLLGALGTRVDAAQPQREGRPNVVLILTDDQGTVDAGCYGARDLHTPAIDALARRGVRFTQFYAASPVCSPSRAGLMTGLYPVRAGVPDNVSSTRGEAGMPASRVTIAEVLAQAGYATGHVGKWHLGYTPETMPGGQGFRRSFGHMGGCIDNYSHFFYWQGPNRHDLWRDGVEVQRPGGFFPDLMVEEAGRFLEENRDRPFFLYFAMNMPHYPYQGEPRWLDRFASLPYPRNLYAAFLATLDERIGRLVDRIDALGLRERTLILFQSDHGHSTEERAHGGGGSAGPFRGAKFSLFEGGIRVPAVASWPGHLPEGVVRGQLASSCDWLPTIATLCGVDTTRLELDGKSLVPVLKDPQAPSPHDVVHWQVGRGPSAQWAVRRGDWKLIGNPLDTTAGPARRMGPIFLSNLASDPGEKENQADSHPDRVAELRELHETWTRAAARP